MNLAPIVELLEAENFGTIGKDLFRNFMPHDVREGLLVTIQMPVEIDRYLNYCKGSFQVVARGTDWESPRLVMVDVSKVLCGEGLSLGDMYFYFMRPRHEPLIFPKSEGDLIEASVNFDFIYSHSLVC